MAEIHHRRISEPETQDEILLALVSGVPRQTIAKEYGVAEATLDLLAESDLFRTEYRQYLEAKSIEPLRKLGDAEAILQEESIEAVLELKRLRQIGTERTRLTASTEILDRAGYGKAQRIDHTFNVVIDQGTIELMEETYDMISKASKYELERD